MEKLKVQYTKDGYEYHLITRTDNAAVFSQTDKESGNIIGYESILIQIRKEQERFGKFYPEAEVVPHTESWGVWGFTFTDAEMALMKMDELQKKYSEKLNARS